MKLTFKINLLFTGIVSCILLGMAFLVYNSSKQNEERDFKTRIRTRAERAAYLFNFLRSDTTNLLKSLDSNSPPLLFNRNVVIYDTSFRELYEFHDPEVQKIQVEREWLEDARKGQEVFMNEGHKVVGVFGFSGNMLVLVAAEDVSGQTYINDLRKIFLIYFPVAVIATLLIGYLFSRSIVKPVKQTIHDVKLITSQNLSHRLYVGKGKDELAQLNETFNSLLNRLEESFAMEKRFISNASHELSTPLTSISSQIEVALLQERDAEQYKRVLTSVLKDALGLQQLTHNLLEIAKTGTNGAISLDRVRVDEVLIKAHTDVLRQDPSFRIELDFDELPEDENECLVFGNPSLLYSAFKNIMENGCKYAPDHRTQVTLHFHGQDLEMVFTNKSNLLSTDEIEKLIEPFYRGSNARNKPGVGLGLTLTRRIISLHKGSLSIGIEAVAGTIIRVSMPTMKRVGF